MAGSICYSKAHVLCSALYLVISVFLARLQAVILLAAGVCQPQTFGDSDNQGQQPAARLSQPPLTAADQTFLCPLNSS